MIGLGSAVTSGVSEAKYSASFDGQGDFIDCGPSINAAANGVSAVSVMFWIKIASDYSLPDPLPYAFALKRAAGSSAFSGRIEANGKITGLIDQTGSGSHISVQSLASIKDGAWHHIAITGTASSQKMYVDGSNSNDSSENDTATGGFTMNTTSDPFTIAGFNNDRFLKCSISEISVFDVVLTQSNIQYAYNNPGINLNLNQGNYDKSANLKAYYKMGDGFFDDKVNGQVNNQVDPKLGSTLITNGNYSNNTTDWQVSNFDDDGDGVPDAQGAMSVNSSGQLEIITTDAIYGTVVQGLTSSDIVEGKTYRFKFDLIEAAEIAGETRTERTSEVRIGIIPTFNASTMGSASSANIVLNDSSLTLGNDRVFYITVDSSLASDTNHRLAIGGRNDITKLIIDNVSLKPFNTNPGITSGGVTFISDNP